MTNHPPRSQTAVEEIRAVHSLWISAVNVGDLDRLLTLVTDDLVLLNPQGGPAGREAFATTFAAAHRLFQIRCTSELDEVVVAGDVAYARANDTLTITPRDGGTAAQFAGYRLTIYRKQADGRWLLARDAHTLTETKPEPETQKRDS